MRELVTLQPGTEPTLAVQFTTLVRAYDAAAASLQPLAPSSAVSLIGASRIEDLFAAGQQLGYSVTACEDLYLFMGTVIAL